jgi:hypothetical protein
MDVIRRQQELSGAAEMYGTHLQTLTVWQRLHLAIGFVAAAALTRWGLIKRVA